MSELGETEDALAERVLNSDYRILRVIVIDLHGRIVGTSQKNIPGMKMPPSGELVRRASAFSVAYGAGQGEKDYPRHTQFAVFAYDDYKVLLLKTVLQDHLLNIRIPRGINAEDVYNNVVQLLQS